MGVGWQGWVGQVAGLRRSMRGVGALQDAQREGAHAQGQAHRAAGSAHAYMPQTAPVQAVCGLAMSPYSHRDLLGRGVGQVAQQVGSHLLGLPLGVGHGLKQGRQRQLHRVAVQGRHDGGAGGLGRSAGRSILRRQGGGAGGTCERASALGRHMAAQNARYLGHAMACRACTDPHEAAGAGRGVGALRAVTPTKLSPTARRPRAPCPTRP